MDLTDPRKQRSRTIIYVNFRTSVKKFRENINLNKFSKSTGIPTYSPYQVESSVFLDSKCSQDPWGTPCALPKQKKTSGAIRHDALSHLQNQAKLLGLRG